MKPLWAVGAFLLGLVLGLVFANEEHATAAAWSTTQLVELGVRLEICTSANEEWQKVSTLQGQVLEHQQAALRQVGPTVRRAYPLWPWSESEAAEKVQ